MSSIRKATHAGSWYEDDAKKLDGQLQTWLDAVDSRLPVPPASVIQVGLRSEKDYHTEDITLPVPNLKAIIAPHAGYSYSGPAAAYAYKCIDPSKYKRIFILGPSHKLRLYGCSLSACFEYDTPLSELGIDRRTITELRETGAFLKDMSKSVDENEHSIEMHLPYIRKVFEGRDISIVPILVGSTTPEQEAEMGEVLAPYLEDEGNLFIISSDFCHWGSRFGYTYYKGDLYAKSQSLTSRDSKPLHDEPQIHTSIRASDGTAIKCLTYPTNLSLPDPQELMPDRPAATQNHNSSNSADKTAAQARREYYAYLKETDNTICGRHPIGVLLGALKTLEEAKIKTELRFTRYEQSSEVISVRDSSVSYASAFVRLL